MCTPTSADTQCTCSLGNAQMSHARMHAPHMQHAKCKHASCMHTTNIPYAHCMQVVST